MFSVVNDPVQTPRRKGCKRAATMLNLGTLSYRGDCTRKSNCIALPKITPKNTLKHSSKPNKLGGRVGLHMSENPYNIFLVSFWFDHINAFELFGFQVVCLCFKKKQLLLICVQNVSWERERGISNLWHPHNTASLATLAYLRRNI